MTAVEQFFKDLCDLGFIEYPDDSLIQDRLNLHLEIERNQKLDAHEKGYMSGFGEARKYYFETYKKDNK